MNGWIALTTTDVLNQFNDSETQAYDTAKGDDMSASLPDIVGKVMDEVQAAYSQGGKLFDPVAGALPATATIPAGEKNRAIAVVRWLYLAALPTGKSLAENRASEAKSARDYWQLIAQRKIGATGAVSVARPGRRVHTRTFDGLAQT